MNGDDIQISNGLPKSLVNLLEKGFRKMNEKTQCCKLDENIQCDCTEPAEDCPILIQKYAKVVWCTDYECAHNLQVPMEKQIEFNKHNYTPFSGDKITGVCTRADLMIRAAHVVKQGYKDKNTKCICRTDKRVTGHLDFSRFVGVGGTIPDANDPSASVWATEMADPAYWENEYKQELEMRD